MGWAQFGFRGGPDLALLMKKLAGQAGYPAAA
jgi:hypothetical protein